MSQKLMDKKYLIITERIANKYSRCKKAKYACVLVLKDINCEREVLIYYTTNGLECRNKKCLRINQESGKNYKNCNTKHAEQRIVELFEADKLFYKNKRYKIKLYINSEPCLECALAIMRLQPQLEKVVIKRTREVNLEGLKLLKKEGINIQEY